MLRAAKGASFSKGRAASRMLPAKRTMKSAPDCCCSRTWLWTLSAVTEAMSLATSAASLNLSRATSVETLKASPARCFISAPASAACSVRFCDEPVFWFCLEFFFLVRSKSLMTVFLSGVRGSGRTEGCLQDVVGGLLDRIGHVLRHPTGVAAEIGLGYAFCHSVGCRHRRIPGCFKSGLRGLGRRLLHTIARPAHRLGFGPGLGESRGDDPADRDPEAGN